MHCCLPARVSCVTRGEAVMTSAGRLGLGATTSPVTLATTLSQAGEGQREGKAGEVEDREGRGASATKTERRRGGAVRSIPAWSGPV